MEKARQPRKPLLNILNHPKKVTTVHLKPLSLYCRLMAADTREGSLPLFRDIPPSPFSEMVVKNIELKRKLDDSCLDDSIETPAKKPYIPSTVSPDLGVGDSFNVVTPETGSQHGPLERQAAIRRQTEDALAGVKSHLNLSSSSETSDGSPPNDVISKTKRRPWSPYIVNRGDVFNFNIDNILSLSPITCDAGPATRATKRCLCDRSPTAGQQVGERGEEPSAIRKSDGNGASNSAAAAVQVNGGHLPHGPLQFLREVGGSFQPLLKPLKPCQVHAAPLEGNQDLKEVLRTISSPSAPSWADVEASEIKVFDEFDCGPPLFESTICEAGEGEGHTMESSFEDSLPLQVQMKSVVVVGNRQAAQETAPALSPKSKRPMPFRSEWDWHRKKRLYMDSIARHTQENYYPGSAMTELLHLTRILGETQGQHPSDLTTRNHQKRLGNERPRMSLAEWKAQSSRTHQGFSMVPQIFQRSPVL